MKSRIQIQKTFYKVSDFISWQKAHQLKLSPWFQRRSVWKLGAKSYLIDTISQGLPIPIIFLRDGRTNLKTMEPERVVIDGQQRLRTVISYVAPNLLEDYEPNRDDFSVRRAHNHELAGKSFGDLADETKRAILDYEFSVHILPSTVDDRDVVQIFRRMNSTNYTLKPQELRNSEFYGEFKSAAYKLAEEQLRRWRDWGTFSEDEIARMDEVEHTSECLIAILSGELSGKAKAKINSYYEKYEDKFKVRGEVERRFRDVMEYMDSTFKSKDSEFTLCKKKTVYTFFVFIYDLLYGLRSNLKHHPKQRTVSLRKIEGIKLVDEKIKTRSAPNRVLESVDRRTTNPKERNILFTFLKDAIK